MEPRPDHDAPKASPEPQSSPEAQPQSRPEAPPPSSRPGAEPYIPLPSAPPAGKNRWWLALAAALAAAAVVGVGVKRHSAALAPATQTAAQTQQVLIVTPADRDAAATASAQALLKQDGAPSRLDAQAAKLKQDLAGPVAQPPTGNPAPQQQVEQALALSPQSVRQAVVDGSAGFYTFHFRDPTGGGGDVIDVAVDGVTIARVVTSPEPASLTIPLDPRTTHTITETLVYARDRRVYVRAGGARTDAGAGAQAHVSVASSAGEVRSNVLLGQSEQWTVRMGGAGSLGQ